MSRELSQTLNVDAGLLIAIRWLPLLSGLFCVSAEGFVEALFEFRRSGEIRDKLGAGRGSYSHPACLVQLGELLFIGLVGAQNLNELGQFLSGAR